ncbi:MAG: class I SAM-dependent methyltransferase [Solirubrobacteraceae bacterium]
MSRPWGEQPADLYDTIGRTYTGTRRSDPRIASAIWAALGDAATVLNVGAGAGAYEPPGREVLALEPSDVMIAQRPPGSAPVVRGRAEELPFEDGAFDAVMAVLSDHHWTDRRRGFAELRRVARERVVLFNANPGEAELFWLTTEYLPEFFELIPSRYRGPGAWEAELRTSLGSARLTPVPIPHDCTDGFYGVLATPRGLPGRGRAGGCLGVRTATLGRGESRNRRAPGGSGDRQMARTPPRIAHDGRAPPRLLRDRRRDGVWEVTLNNSLLLPKTPGQLSAGLRSLSRRACG